MPDNRYRVAELRGRVRSAKKMERRVGAMDRGAKLAANGRTIMGNRSRAAMVNAVAYYGYDTFNRSLNKYLNNRLRTLYGTGQYRQGHANVAKLINKVGNIGYWAAVGAYNLKLEADNKALRAYNTSRWNGEATIKNVGSEEYKYRKEQSKKKKG